MSNCNWQAKRRSTGRKTPCTHIVVVLPLNQGLKGSDFFHQLCWIFKRARFMTVMLQCWWVLHSVQLIIEITRALKNNAFWLTIVALMKKRTECLLMAFNRWNSKRSFFFGACETNSVLSSGIPITCFPPQEMESIKMMILSLDDDAADLYRFASFLSLIEEETSIVLPLKRRPL